MASPTTKKILIVDDETAIRNFADRVLQGAGYTTALAASAQEALEVAGTFDLLVTDLMMPEMKGDELARLLRNRQPDLRVLYLTAFSDRLFDYRPGLWKNETFLDKPYSPNALLEAVSLRLSTPPA